MNERGLLTGFVLRMVLGLAVVAVVLFDAGAIVVNFFGLDSTAKRIAEELSLEIATDNLDPSNPRLVKKAARKLARAEGAKLVSVEVTGSGRVDLQLSREAETLVVRRVGAFEDWGMATASARASGP